MLGHLVYGRYTQSDMYPAMTSSSQSSHTPLQAVTAAALARVQAQLLRAFAHIPLHLHRA